MRHALLLLCIIATPAVGQINVDDAWARATAPGSKIAAGYMTIRNLSASPDRLVSASSPVAARVQTHVTVKEGEVFRMREVKGYDVPAGGSFELKPGGAHLMLVDVRRPLKEGEKVPLTLRFQRAGEVKAELQVRPLGDTSMHGMH
jgi:periplasmic copper chaperone A